MLFETVRFSSILLVILTFVVCNQLVAFLLQRKFVAGVEYLPLLLVLILRCWFLLYAPGMTRQRRALFNEANVMVTYQPRAYTDGYMFVAETPTPAPNCCQPLLTQQLSAFEKARDEHYKGEFNSARKMALEKDASPTIKTRRIESMRIEFEETDSIRTDSSGMRSPTSKE